MRCRRAQRLLVEFEDSTMPADVAAHLDQCPACRARHDRMTAVRKLVSLKRHEQPDNVTEARIRSSVRRRIQSLDTPQADDDRITLWELLTLEPLPVARYAAVALLIGFAAFMVFSRRPPSAMQAATEPAPARQLAADTNVAAPASVQPTFIAVAAPSNAGSGRVDYGPLPSVPVRLDY